MTDLERLLSKVERDKKTECWNWTASLNTSGYGHMKLRGTLWPSHRLSYKLHRGPIPDGICVCHRCDNRKCINPEHLFLGTRLDNATDMVAKGRQPRTRQSGSANGMAKLTTSDIAAIRGAVGVPQKDLARRYGVSRPHISQIRTGGRWGHLR
jgi:hypothetical protein